MNRKHTDEEREQSVLYYLESGKGMATISKELGIGVNTLNRWVRGVLKQMESVEQLFSSVALKETFKAKKGRVYAFVKDAEGQTYKKYLCNAKDFG
ncbi:MAG: transposase [Saccharofermentans sp.]|nr:transposase [Saccharofermentans sp.]